MTHNTQDALDMALRMVRAIPLPDLIAFRKLSKAWFALAEVLAQAHTSTLLQQMVRSAGLCACYVCVCLSGLGCV
jgi:exportin-7